jgi:hypothetical protein
VKKRLIPREIILLIAKPIKREGAGFAELMDSIQHQLATTGLIIATVKAWTITPPVIFSLIYKPALASFMIVSATLLGLNLFRTGYIIDHLTVRPLARSPSDRIPRKKWGYVATFTALVFSSLFAGLMSLIVF